MEIAADERFFQNGVVCGIIGGFVLLPRLIDPRIDQPHRWTITVHAAVLAAAFAVIYAWTAGPAYRY